MALLIPSSITTGERADCNRSASVCSAGFSQSTAHEPPEGGTTNFRCAARRGFVANVLRLLCVLLAFIGSTAPQSGFAAETSKEYNVKAAFLYNFARFVEWPSTAFTEADSPFVFGVLGENPFGNALEDAVAGRTVLGRKLAVRRFDHVPTNEPCHLLFISASEKKQLPAVLAALGERRILVVGEDEAFARNGGSIAFVMDPAGKLRFQINTDAVRKAGLRVNAQLLKLAVKVWGRPSD